MSQHGRAYRPVGKGFDHDSSPDPDNGFTGYGYQDPITEPIPVVEDENSGYGYVEAEPNVDDLTDYADTQGPPGPSPMPSRSWTVAPSSAADSPELTSQPAPPPPPPPPPPAPDTPVYRPQYPPSGGGSGSQAPRIGVTRAPLSVAPKPVTAPTSAEVGKHGSNDEPLAVAIRN